MSTILLVVLAAAVGAVGLVVLDIWPTTDTSGRAKKIHKAAADTSPDAPNSRRAANFGRR